MRLIQFSKKLLFVPVAAGALLCSCMEATEGESEKNTLTVDPESSFTYNINGNVNFFDSTEQEDSEYDEKEFKNEITIQFYEDAAPKIEYNGLEDEVTITSYEDKGKAHLIIRAEKKVNYILKGTSKSGSLLIFSEKKFKLTLDNLNLSNDSGLPAICSQTKKRCFIETKGTATIKDAEGDGNYSLGSEYVKVKIGEEIEYYDAKGAIFSEGELIFCGSGTLNVEGRCKHAIASDQYVRINEGANVNIIGSNKDGIQTNDAVLIYGGKLNIKNVGKLFNLHSNQYPNLYSSRKMNGIQCEKGYIVVKGGEIDITSLGYGIYANCDDFNKSDIMTKKSFIYIDGGKINIETTEDEGHGISSKSHLIISGDAKINITATGDDAKGIETDGNEDYAVEAEYERGDIVLAGGTVTIFSKDSVVDPSGKLNIVGGTLNAIGGSCFSRDKVEKGSKPCGIASFDKAMRVGEEITVAGNKISTLYANLTTAKVVLINDTLKAGDEVEVKVGSQTAKAEVE